MCAFQARAPTPRKVFLAISGELWYNIYVKKMAMTEKEVQAQTASGTDMNNNRRGLRLLLVLVIIAALVYVIKNQRRNPGSFDARPNDPDVTIATSVPPES